MVGPRLEPEFWIWALWVRRGRIPAQRPPTLPKRIPPKTLAKWQAEYARRGFKPIKPPAPKPLLGTFADPGAWLSWEIKSDGWSGATVASEAQEVGAKWVALDVALGETGDVNVAAFPDVARECAKLGIKAGLWGEIHSAEAVHERLTDTGAPFYIINREAPGQTEPGFLPYLRALAPLVELAVVAGPFDAFPNPNLDPAGWETETKPWLGLPMLVEAYTGENPQATPEAQKFQAIQRGFTRIACVVESNESHGWTLDAIDVAATRTLFGHSISLYLLGTASDADKAKFRLLAA